MAVPPSNQPKPAMAVSRSAHPLVQLVHQRLDQDELWKFRSVNELWICPYCLGAVAKRPGLAHNESIARHLENCRPFALGKGQPQARNKIAEKRAYENMSHAAQTDPAWRIFDSDGVWISPFSLQRVPSVRTTGKLDNFLYQAMARHLATCAFYRQGISHPADEVLLARELHRRITDVARYVSYQLHTQEAWRFIDATSTWICPYTLFAVPGIFIGTQTQWVDAPHSISLHLITHCPRFATGQVQPHPLDVIANAAGPNGNCLPAPSASAPTPVSPTQLLGTTSRLGLQILSPTASTAIPGERTSTSRILPRIATPIPGSLPTAHPTGQSGGHLFSRNPDQRERTSIQAVAPPSPSVPMPAPFSNAPTVAAPILPPIATPLPRVVAVEAPPQPAPAAETSEDQGGLDWMDVADSAHAAATPLPDQSPRTDMISARQLQEKLMLQAPETPGFRFATRFEACSDITGDFFVFIPLSDRRIGFALGDVSGHGVQAGLIMSMAKKTLEIYASQGLSPAQTLARVNDALVSDLGGKMFISMVYAILDPDSATITWARAGHNPALSYNIISNEVHEIRPRGMVVGMKSGQVFRDSLDEEVTHLQAGDLFLLYTDGITETMNLQNDEFGTDRLTDVLRQFSPDGPDAVLEQIMGRLRHFRGPRPPADDATMVALLVE